MARYAPNGFVSEGSKIPRQNASSTMGAIKTDMTNVNIFCDVSEENNNFSFGVSMTKTAMMPISVITHMALVIMPACDV